MNKEELFYVMMPYLYSGAPNVLKQYGKNFCFIGYRDVKEGEKVKFTKKEIEEKFPAYANEYFMVRVDNYE